MHVSRLPGGPAETEPLAGANHRHSSVSVPSGEGLQQAFISANRSVHLEGHLLLGGRQRLSGDIGTEI